MHDLCHDHFTDSFFKPEYLVFPQSSPPQLVLFDLEFFRWQHYHGLHNTLNLQRD
jgi:hypothetical protein